MVESSGVSLNQLSNEKEIDLPLHRHVLFVYLRDTDHPFLTYRTKVTIFMANNLVITIHAAPQGAYDPPLPSVSH